MDTQKDTRPEQEKPPRPANGEGLASQPGGDPDAVDPVMVKLLKQGQRSK